MTMRKIITYSLLIILGISIPWISGCGKKVKPQIAKLKITLTPADATIIHNGKVIKKLKENVTPNTYIIKFAKEGYKPVWRKYVCTPEKPINDHVVLEPVTASVLINSRPAKAQVVINDKVVGATPMILRDQPIGSGSAIVKLYGYTDVKVEWKITEDGRPKEVMADLNSNLGNLEVTTNPARVNLYIDGRSRGLTPFKDKIIQGNHKIVLKRRGYADVEKIISVQRDKLSKIKVSMLLLPGSIKVETSPKNAQLFINGRQYQNTPFTLKDVNPGTYKVKVQRHGFDQEERDVEVRPGEVTTVSFKMESNTGGIDLVVNPPGVSIYVNGKYHGKTVEDENRKGMSKIYRIRGISSGEYEIKTAHKRAEPSEKTCKVIIHKRETVRPKPILMWIRDTYLKLKNGREYKGRLHSENSKEIMFEPIPGVRQRYSRDEIEKMEPLKVEE